MPYLNSACKSLQGFKVSLVDDSKPTTWDLDVTAMDIRRINVLIVQDSRGWVLSGAFVCTSTLE